MIDLWMRLYMTGSTLLKGWFKFWSVFLPISGPNYWLRFSKNKIWLSLNNLINFKNIKKRRKCIGNKFIYVTFFLNGKSNLLLSNSLNPLMYATRLEPTTSKTDVNTGYHWARSHFAWLLKKKWTVTWVLLIYNIKIYNKIKIDTFTHILLF